MRRKEASEMLQVRSFMPLSYAQNKLWIPPPPQIVFACSSNCLRLRCFPRFGGRVGVSLARKHGFSMLVRIRELISQNWPFIFVAFEERVVTRPEQMRIKWLLLWPGLNILGTYQISSNYSEEWRVFFSGIAKSEPHHQRNQGDASVVINFELKSGGFVPQDSVFFLDKVLKMGKIEKENHKNNCGKWPVMFFFFFFFGPIVSKKGTETKRVYMTQSDVCIWRGHWKWTDAHRTVWTWTLTAKEDSENGQLCSTQFRSGDLCIYFCASVHRTFSTRQVRVGGGPSAKRTRMHDHGNTKEQSSNVLSFRSFIVDLEIWTFWNEIELRIGLWLRMVISEAKESWRDGNLIIFLKVGLKILFFFALFDRSLCK